MSVFMKLLQFQRQFSSIQMEKYSAISCSIPIYSSQSDPRVTSSQDAGQRKGFGVLLKWSKDIVNHFWFCCKQASTYEEFMCMWRGLLQHVTNQHTWLLSYADAVNQCTHGPIADVERTKPWLDKKTDSATLSALAGVILDKRFLNRIHYVLNFRSTSEIETFNQLILMYCSKRYAYSPPVYRMRNLLAAIDHNVNVDRPLRKNKEGNIYYNGYFNKKSARWSVFPVKEKKTYNHVRVMAKNALVMRLNDNVGMRSPVLEADDPRRTSRHLTPISPPPTDQLVREHISRFRQEDKD